MKRITIDPKNFISSPYWKCPKCNASSSFGVLMVREQHYVRRCKNCWHTSDFPLPRLNKKVIYIDQFAVSNMMKVLNPKTKAYQKKTLDVFWLRLFEKLDILCELQLIICPYSGSHIEESLLSPYYGPLKRMYELLSHGLSFYDHETIERFQICEHAENWLSGKENKKLKLDTHSVIPGNINAWQDKLIFSINFPDKEGWVEELRGIREKTHKGHTRVFQRWQTDKDKTFEDWYEEESMDFGRITLQIYFGYFAKLKKVSSSRTKLTTNDLLPPPSVTLIRSIHKVFRRTGIQDSDIIPKTVEYLTSPSLKNVPFNRISSMLYAALARKAAAGRRKPPNVGLATDIRIISVLLPYCDAMFIDNECHAYLNERPLSQTASDYETEIFSQNTKEELLDYLNKIESEASAKHLKKVKEVYGETGPEPYTTLYEKQE